MIRWLMVVEMLNRVWSYLLLGPKRIWSLCLELVFKEWSMIISSTIWSRKKIENKITNQLVLGYLIMMKLIISRIATISPKVRGTGLCRPSISGKTDSLKSSYTMSRKKSRMIKKKYSICILSNRLSLSMIYRYSFYLSWWWLWYFTSTWYLWKWVIVSRCYWSDIY